MSRSNGVSCILNGSRAHKWLWNIIHCAFGKHWFPGLCRLLVGPHFACWVPTTTDLSRRACGPGKLMDTSPKFKFPKFKFSPQNSNSVMDNKHCQLFPFKWPSLFIFEKMLANIPLNNRSGFEWRHVNTVSVETVVLLPACWLWEKCQCLKNRLTRELNWKNQTDGWLYLKNDWNEEIMEFMWFRPTSPHAWSSPVATAPFHPCLSEVFFFF